MKMIRAFTPQGSLHWYVQVSYGGGSGVVSDMGTHGSPGLGLVPDWQSPSAREFTAAGATSFITSVLEHRANVELEASTEWQEIEGHGYRVGEPHPSVDKPYAGKVLNVTLSPGEEPNVTLTQAEDPDPVDYIASGVILSLRVLRSDLYAQLDDRERAAVANFMDHYGRLLVERGGEL